MSRAIPELAEILAGHGGTKAKLRACVVTSEFLGPFKNGGIATATSGLIDQLLADGHQVTILYTLVERGVPTVAHLTWAYWCEQFAARGARLEFIPNPEDYRAWRRKAWLVKDFLGNGDFDLVYFNEHHGSGYYALAAKRAGLAPFSEQLHCVITHGSVEWVFATNDQYIHRATDLEVMGFERRSVEWADVVIGPSRYLLRQYERYGWKLPELTFNQPYPLLRSGVAAGSDLVAVDELVFFGRLETRKGLWLFCDAIDRMAESLRNKVVTFLGRMTDFSGVSSGALILARASNWPFRIKLLTDYDQDQALAYLRRPGRLAVMPSLADNSPCVIYECMEHAIPFVATRASGADELVHADSFDEAMVDATPAALADRLSQILVTGASHARPRFDPQSNLATWSAWHDQVAASRTRFIGHGPQSEVAVRRDATTTLIVAIDDGRHPLGPLVDALTNNIERFGALAGLLVLSPRKDVLQDFLYAALHPRAVERDSSVVVLSPDEVEDACAGLSSADAVFLLDAPFELLSPFFFNATSLLATGRAASVSCLSGLLRETGEVDITELPHGDVPAVSALGRSIGSRTWAFSHLLRGVKPGDIYDEERDEFLSSAAIGNAIAHRSMEEGEAFLLLPVLGAVGRGANRTHRRPRSYREVTAAARNLGLTPSIFSGGAAWFALSSYAAASTQSEFQDVAGTSALDSSHPLLESEPKQLAEFAAALGRLGQAVPLGLAGEKAGAEVRSLVDIAKRAVRARHRYRLEKLLLGPVRSIGGHGNIGSVEKSELRSRVTALLRGAEAGAEEAQDSAAEIPDEPELPEKIRREVRVYLDTTLLTLRGGRVCIGDVTGMDRRPGLFFVDVPVAGHQRIVSRLMANASERMAVKMVVVDQTDGAEVGGSAADLVEGRPAELSVPLHAIYATVTIAFELWPSAAASQMQEHAVRFDKLRVE